MAKPSISIPTAGTDPRIATKENLEAEVNEALGQNYDEIEGTKEALDAEEQARVDGDEAALDLGSRPAQSGAAFHYGDSDDVFAVLDDEGNPLLGVGADGTVFPGLPVFGAFFDGTETTPFVITDEDGRALLEFDDQGEPVGVATGADLEGRVETLEGDFDGLEVSVNSLVEDGIPGLQNLATSSEGLSDGAPYAEKRALRFAPPYSTLYTDNPSTIIPDHLALYALYDSLLASHPQYITRTKLGEDAIGNEIFQYAFEPPDFTGNLLIPESDRQKPKIVHVTGLHGFEKGSQIATYAFFKEMCEDWKNRRWLYEMRWGCDFIVVPALTPSSIDQDTRTNHNGVDINRNFPTGWEENSDDPESNYYRGPSAGSEPETQIAMGLVASNPDACAYVDHHMSSSFTSQGYTMWVSANLTAAQQIAMPYLHDMTAYLRHEFSSFDSVSEGTPTTQMGTTIPGSATREWEQSGTPSYLFETPTGGGFDGTLETRRHNVEATRRWMQALYQAETTRRQMAALIGD